MTQVVRFQ